MMSHINLNDKSLLYAECKHRSENVGADQHSTLQDSILAVKVTVLQCAAAAVAVIGTYLHFW
jgi:hypothetical protein